MKRRPAAVKRRPAHAVARGGLAAVVARACALSVITIHAALAAAALAAAALAAAAHAAALAAAAALVASLAAALAAGCRSVAKQGAGVGVEREVDSLTPPHLKAE